MPDKSSSESGGKKRIKKTDCKLKAQNEMVEVNANIWETSECGW